LNQTRADAFDNAQAFARRAGDSVAFSDNQFPFNFCAIKAGLHHTACRGFRPVCDVVAPHIWLSFSAFSMLFSFSRVQAGLSTTRVLIHEACDRAGMA
jgi:hypothetical protein